MTDHPLTDKILDQFGMPDDLWSKGERIFFDDDMRAAYDKGRADQAEQQQDEAVHKFIENNSAALTKLSDS